MHTRDDQPSNLTDYLFHDAFRGIFNFLPPHAATLLLIAVNSDPKSQIVKKDAAEYYSRNNELWRDKLHSHFPHRLRRLIKRKNVDWHAEFKKTYLSEYKQLSKSEKELFTLVKEGNVAGLDEKLKAGELKLKDLFLADKKEISLLTWIRQHKKAKRSLLDFFYKVATKQIKESDKEMRTILHWAVILDQSPATIQEMISEQVVKVNSPSLRMGTALHIAAKEGFMNILHALLEEKADVNAVNGRLGRTPLYVAAEQGNLEVVNALLATVDIDSEDEDEAIDKVKINKAGRDGQTPLYIAAEKGHLEIVAALLDKKADPTIAISKGQQTPITIAKEKGHHGIVSILEARLEPSISAQTSIARRAP
ncbi:MAG: ankyrin repeat domain-containing protein [Gammaproteobacteria bacterium]